MQILLIGVNHRTAPVALRERLAFSEGQARRAADELRGQGALSEAVIVSTCNRSEIYGVAPVVREDALRVLAERFGGFHGIALAESDGHLYGYQDLETVRHLFRVAAGLDSMLLGEAEILGQVRDAYQRALASGTTGPVLNRLFQSALEVGKRVRTETDLGTRPMSAAFAAVKLAEQIFGRMHDHRALVLGAGTVSEQVVAHLRDRGLTHLAVANRSREQGERLAGRVGAEGIAWEGWEQALVVPDIVVTSVASAEPILTRAMLERAMSGRHNRTLFVIDLGIPRNVEPAAGDLYNVYLYNIDDLSSIVEQNRRAREGEIPHAEAIVAEQVAKFQAWQAGVQLTTLLGELRAKLRAEREEFLHERREEIRKLSGEEQQRFGRLAEALLDHILREPSRKLRLHLEVPLQGHEVEAVRQLLGLARGKH